MRVSTLIKGVLVLIVALIVTAVAILYSTDFSAYKGEISKLVRDATGRELVIEGDFKPRIGLKPAVTVEGVRFANASWGSRKDMARIKHFRAEMELLPIFLGDIRITQIVLSGADILLESRTDGAGNWVMEGGTSKTPDRGPAAEEGGAVTVPSVDKVLIEDSVLAWRDGRTGAGTTVRIDRLRAMAEAEASLQLAFRGRYNGEKIALDGRIGALKMVIAGAPLPVDLDIGAGGSAIKVKGTIRQPLAGKGIELAVSAAGDDLAMLNGVVGASLPSIGPYRVSGTLLDQARGWQLKGLSLTVGKSDLSGNVTVDAGAEPLGITANLTGSLIRAEDFTDRNEPRRRPAARSGGGKAKDAEMAPAENKRVFPTDRIPVDGLKAVNAGLSLRAGRVETNGQILRNVSIEMILKDGWLKLHLTDADFANGRISAELTFDGARAIPAMTLTTRVAKLDLGVVAGKAGQDKLIEGRIDAVASLTGSGQSIGAVMAGLNGSIETTMGQGRLSDDLLELLSADVVKAIAPPSTGDKGLRINCLVGRYAVKDGKLVSRATVFDTSRLLLVGEGGIDLATERIDFLIDPSAKEVSIMKLVTPLRVGGTLASPTIYPDPGGVVKGALGIAAGIATGGILVPLVGSILSDSAGSKDKNPCLAALSAAKSGKATAPPKTSADGKPSTPADDVGKAIEGIGKGIGEGLKGLFGR